MVSRDGRDAHGVVASPELEKLTPETLVTLGIMGAQIRAPLKLFNTIVCCDCLMGFRGAPNCPASQNVERCQSLARLIAVVFPSWVRLNEVIRNKSDS